MNNSFKLSISIPILLTVVLLTNQVQAGVNVCSNDFNNLHSRAVFSKTGSGSIDNSSSSISQQLVGLDLIGPLPSTETHASHFGAGHRYTIFDINGVATQTNGHVHTFYLPYFHKQQIENGALRFSVAPAISASSNIIKNRGNWRHESFQLLGGFRFESNNNWYAGSCADYRFGKFKIYPVFAWMLSTPGNWQLELGLPDSSARYQLRDTISLQATIGPDGNQWEVSDTLGSQRSRFGYRAYLLAFNLEWRPMPRLFLGIGVARRFAQKLDLLLTNGQRVSLNTADTNELSATLHWVFGKHKN